MFPFESAETLNIPYARKVLEHLVAHPEEHNQGIFAIKTPCRTAACIAGTTVLMDPQVKIHWRGGYIMDHVVVDGCIREISDHAKRLLGLSYADARNLFFTGDNKYVLKQLAHYIAEAEKVQI